MKPRPGHVLRESLNHMRSYLVDRQAAGESDEVLRPVVKSYLSSVFLPSTGDKLSIRNRDEMRLLAEAVDLILAGDVVRAAEMLILRFKAVETSHVDGSWAQAKHIVPLPEAQVSSLTREERASLAQDERREQRLTQLRTQNQRPRSPSG